MDCATTTTTTTTTPTPPGHPMGQEDSTHSVFVCRWRGCTHDEIFSSSECARKHEYTTHFLKPDVLCCQLNECTNAYPKTTSLRRHFKTHCQRSFVCEICDRAFNREDKYEQHLTSMYHRKQAKTGGNTTPRSMSPAVPKSERQKQKQSRRYLIRHMEPKPKPYSRPSRETAKRMKQMLSDILDENPSTPRLVMSDEDVDELTAFLLL